MEFMELVAFDNSLAKEFKAKCPFKEDCPDSPPKEDENLANDDKDKQQEAQANDGGVLGENLKNGKPGKANGKLYPPEGRFLYQQSADDSYRGRCTYVKINNYADIASGNFPITVAAHHLIPGNAVLYKSSLFKFMQEGKEVKSAKDKTYTILTHIGYDVNGSHNGVWLAGNYAIHKSRPAYSFTRKDGIIIHVQAKHETTPVPGLSWRELSKNNEPWQYDYVAGACKATNGQFHDSHERPYSEDLRLYLKKINYRLSHHLDNCEDCKIKDKIPPPYRIKNRLYAISACLRNYLTVHPSSWKHPWFTSERWSKMYFKNGKITEEFIKKYNEAQETNKPDPFAFMNLE